MGVLRKGHSLEWEDSQKYFAYFKKHSMIQYINIWKKHKNRSDGLKWGDEIEALLIKVSHDKKTAQLLLSSEDLRCKIAKNQKYLFDKFPAPTVTATTTTTTTTITTTTITTTTTNSICHNICKKICCCFSTESKTESKKKLQKRQAMNVLDFTGSPRITITSFDGPYLVFVPEFNNFQIETTPALPYGSSLNDIQLVKASMDQRSEVLKKMLDEDGGEIYLQLSCFPTLGTKNFLYPPSQDEKFTYSKRIPDRVITPHVRYSMILKNMLASQRPCSYFAKVPLYQDKNTKNAIDAELAEQKESHMASEFKEEQWDPYTDVMVDSLVDGTAHCCLQTTFQASSFQQSLYLYDQAVILGPILMALTASSSFCRGKLLDIDTRYNKLADIIDDRSPFERGLTKDCVTYDGYQTKVNPRSRWCSSPFFISEEKICKDKYNDLDLPHDDDMYNYMIGEGVSKKLVKHLAYMSLRKPMILYADTEEIDDNKHAAHFEMLNSTCWYSARWKPPALDDDDIGWRVEFRTMEVQLGTFQNAAIAVFSSLLVRTLCKYKLNLYMPMSKVDKNMEIATKRDAITKEKFFFRKNIETKSNDEIVMMTMEEIMLGKEENNFRGLISLINEYLDSLPSDSIDNISRTTIDEYIKFVELRVRGELLTVAAWIRKFVINHPKYKQDSIINDAINYDLVMKSYEIATGKCEAPELNCHTVRDNADGTIPNLVI